VAVPCTGAYVSGAAGSNVCPAGFVRIVTEAACLTAADAAGKTVRSGFVVTYYAYPRGCFYRTSTNYAYFNTHNVGAGLSDAQLLCAAAATGAPHARRSARARAPARAAAMRVCAARKYSMVLQDTQRVLQPRPLQPRPLPRPHQGPTVNPPPCEPAD
jgi:hypothetical protein